MSTPEQKAYQHAYYMRNRERVLARTKARDAANPELARAETRRWYVRNRADKLAKNAQWREANPERMVELNEAWRLANKERKYATRNRWRTETGVGNADKAARLAAQKQAMPPWLTRAQKREMNRIYQVGRFLGLHVDHIAPLRGKRVSGLHVPWNLQLLTPTDNMRKSAQFD